MDMSELNTSLQNMINLSSSETEDKDELSHPLKKSKGSTKSKPLRSKAPKRTPKCRARKMVDRLTKIPAKRCGKTFVAYQNKSYNNITGICSEDPDQKFLPVSNEAAHLLPIVGVLKKYNFKYEIKPDINKQHDDFFLQDKYMNAFFNYYPDFICVDFLCEIIEVELNLYLFISVDSNGYCEIIGIGLFKSCESGLLWFCETFKKHNLNWRKIRLIMCDKKAKNKEILKSSFPEKLILISFFHSMKTLKKDLSNLDYKVTDEEVNKVLQIFEQMIFAPDESSYSELLKQLKSMPPDISTYFRKAWHQKKDLWALSQQLNSKIFFKSFNTYLNLVRKTIRPLISTLDSVEAVIQTLCTNLEKMRVERFQKITTVFYTPSVNHKQLSSQKYSKLLTAYAVQLLSEQISCCADVKNMKKLASSKYICSSEDIVTINTCSCNFFQLFSLPCSHIFSVRKLLSLPFYAESLCSFHWISTNYQNTFIELQNVFSTDFQNHLNNGKFQKYFKISADLWPLLVSVPDDVSQERLLLFMNLIRAWKYGIKVSLKTSIIQKDNSTQEDASSDYWKEMYGVSIKDILDSDNDISVLPLTL